jgi:hypothetical protein
MLRLIHAQSVQGALLVDDIDDGLPNKNVHRLGSLGDPAAYKRDGYANEPKQPVYIPRTKPTDVAVAGYIDLNETQRVLLSAENGKIAGLQTAGLISTVSLVAADLVAPVVTNAEVDLPAVGDITIDGTGFLSVAPETTSVQLWGAGVGALPGITLTLAQIIAVAPGAVSDVQIIIDTTLVPGLAAGDFVAVTADAQVSNTFVVVT